MVAWNSGYIYSSLFDQKQSIKALIRALFSWIVSDALTSAHKNSSLFFYALSNVLRSFCALKKKHKSALVYALFKGIIGSELKEKRQFNPFQSMLFLRTSWNSVSGTLLALIMKYRERRSYRAHEVASGALSAAHMSTAH